MKDQKTICPRCGMAISAADREAATQLRPTLIVGDWHTECSRCKYKTGGWLAHCPVCGRYQGKLRDEIYAGWALSGFVTAISLIIIGCAALEKYITTHMVDLAGVAVIVSIAWASFMAVIWISCLLSARSELRTEWFKRDAAMLMEAEHEEV